MDDLATVIPFPLDRVSPRPDTSAPEADSTPQDYWALLQRLREERQRLRAGSG